MTGEEYADEVLAAARGATTTYEQGFRDGEARAEREAWEVLAAYMGPPGPLDTHERPLPADARETMTLAAALSALLGSMVPRRPPSQWTRFEALERAVEDYVTSWISVGGPRLHEALACRQAVQGARLAFEQPEARCVVMSRGFHRVEVMTPDEFCDRWRMGYQ